MSRSKTTARSLPLAGVIHATASRSSATRQRGRLDPSFGTAGKVLTRFSRLTIAWAVAIQSDGKIVAAGGPRESADFALARYNPNGSPDSS